jgi:hypothetical protein
MSNFQLAGIVLFMVGLVLWTVGGLIYLARHPKGWNLFLTTQSSKSSDVAALQRSMFTDPKSRWWCLSGFPTCIAGFVLLVISTVPFRQVALTTALFAAYMGVRELIRRRR